MKSEIGLNLMFPKKRETNGLLPLFCLFLTLAGLLLSIFTAVHFPCRAAILICIVAIYCGLCYLLFSVQKNHRWISILIVLSVFLVLCYMFNGAIVDGIMHAFGFFSETIEETQKVAWKYQAFSTYDDTSITLAFLVIFFPLTLLLGYAILYRCNFFLWLFVIVPLVEPMLFFGLLPSLFSFILLLCAGIICWSIAGAQTPARKNVGDVRNTHSAGMAGLLLAVCISGMFALLLVLVSQEGYATFLHNVPGRSQAQNTLQQTFSVLCEERTPPQGGITGGEFQRAEQFSFTGKTALKVEVDKFQGYFYLRGFVGGDYTSEGWRPATESVDMSTDITQLDMAELSGLFHGQEKIIRITRGEAAEENYDYTPYRVTNKDGKTVTYLEVANYDNNLFLLSRESIYHELLEFTGLSAGTVTSADIKDCFREEAECYGIAKKSYVTIPDAVQAYYNEFSPLEGSFENAENMIKYVMGNLSARADYTLSPGETPKGKDFATYFLYENQKGYCTHFATAATLIFRSMGVPARYAEGYVVTAEDYTRATPLDDGRYLLNVRDTASHAWCEVYLSGFGWLPVEVTPGLTASVTGDTAAADGEEITYETDSETESHEIAVDTPQLKPEQKTQATSDGASGNGDGMERIALPWWIWLVLLFLFATLLLCGVRLVSLYKWKKRLYEKDRRKAILGWFSFFEMVNKSTTDQSLIKWTKEQENADCFPAHTLTVAAPVVQKAAYSKTKLTNMEFEAAKQGLSSSIRFLYQKRNFLGKLNWLFIARLPLPRGGKSNA